LKCLALTPKRKGQYKLDRKAKLENRLLQQPVKSKVEGGAKDGGAEERRLKAQ
jgi:hypothetical protein